MRGCWAVTCHVHFWQNKGGLLRAIAVTLGWNMATKDSALTADPAEENSPAAPAPGIEPTTFQTRVCWSTTELQPCEKQRPAQCQHKLDQRHKRYWPVSEVFCRLRKSSTNVHTARMEAGLVGLRTSDGKCWSMHFIKCLDICCQAFFWRVMFLVQPSSCSVFLWRVMFLVQPSNRSVFLWRVMFLVQPSNCSVFLWRVMFLVQPSNRSVFLWRVPLFLIQILTPSLPQLVKFLGLKVHTHMDANSIFDGPVTNRLSTLCISIFDGPVTNQLPTLCILTEVFSCAHAKGGKPVMISSLALSLVVFWVMVQQPWQWTG